MKANVPARTICFITLVVFNLASQRELNRAYVRSCILDELQKPFNTLSFSCFHSKTVKNLIKAKKIKGIISIFVSVLFLCFSKFKFISII
jgi:hypothetical protein